MKPHRQRPVAAPDSREGRAAQCRAAGFSLIEILVAVTLLAVIVLGLLAMFDQTQKAFRLSLTQTDVLQTGRALQEMMNRDFAQISPCGASNVANVFVGQPSAPMRLNLPGGGGVRTNVTERIYFLTRYNMQWQAVDYAILPDTAGSGVGTLYRYVSNSPLPIVPQPANDYLKNFVVGQTNPPSRVADGIVHFVVRAYDTNGLLMLPPMDTNGVVIVAGALPDAPTYRFSSNALPAALEVEFAIMEPQALATFRALGDSPAAANQFLSQQASKVHLFRQRITLPDAQSAVVP